MKYNLIQGEGLPELQIEADYVLLESGSISFWDKMKKPRGLIAAFGAGAWKKVYRPLPDNETTEQTVT